MARLICGSSWIGRPTKLNVEIMAKAWSYLDWVQGEEAEIIVKEGIDKDGKSKWQQKSVRLPSKVGLAVYLGVVRETMDNWAKDSAEFSDILKHVRDLQEKTLVEEGASGRFNPQVTTRILAAKHKYQDRTDLTTDEKPIGVVVLPAIAQDGNADQGN